jgi:hypothetical protein
MLTGVSAVIAGLLAFALGASASLILWSALLGSFPVSILIGLLTHQIIAPTLVPTGEFRSTLYGGDDEAAAVAAKDDGSSRPEPVRRLRVARVVLNGGILVALVSLLAGASGLFRLERAAFDLVPGLATRSGPMAFPVAVRIREDGLDFTNGSTGPWTCTLDIGLQNFKAPPFELEAGQTRRIWYVSFTDGTAPLTTDAGYWGARQHIVVECLDRLGVSHYASL